MLTYKVFLLEGNKEEMNIVDSGINRKRIVSGISGECSVELVGLE